MNIFIDTEFNGYQGALISIALVAEVESNWVYGVLPLPADVDPWVADNVIPKLMFPPRSLQAVRDEIVAWLGQFDSVHLIADWPDDITHFLNLLITGPGMRVGPDRFTVEVRRDIGSEHSAIPHNALNDAFAIRKSWLATQRNK
jgi:hypothetical protein